MGIGDDGGGFQLLAGGQPDAGHAAILEDDLVDRRIDPDLDAAGLRRPGQRLGDSAHAALDEGPAPGRLLELARRVIAIEIGAFGRVGPRPDRDQAIEGEEALDVVRGEVLLQQAVRRSEDELVVELALPGILERPHDIRSPGRRRAENERTHQLAEAPEPDPEFEKALRVGRADALELPQRPVDVLPQEQMAAVGKDREALNLGRRHLQPEIAQRQLLDDLRPEGALHEGAGGEFGALDQLFGDAGAAHDVARLDHGDLQPGQGQIIGGHQPVVAGADQDDIELAVHRPLSPPRHDCGRRLCAAAIRASTSSRRRPAGSGP